MTHQASVPSVAADYFRRFHDIDTNTRDGHPLIVATYRPESSGWKRYPIRKRVSGAWLRKLRAEGVTHVALSAAGHEADFSCTELLARPSYPRWTPA